MGYSENLDVIDYLTSFNDGEINYSINELMRCKSYEKEEIIDYIVKITKTDNESKVKIKSSLWLLVN